ncbi:hypothetical protein C8R46DRAFT_1252315 [Mycena filopes]|nr:hypothetical protein C8R46DRAFT_1252315 [Mycena filopes]
MTQTSPEYSLLTPAKFYHTPKPPRKHITPHRPPLAPLSLTTTATPSQQPSSAPSTQPRSRAPKRTEWQKADSLLATITKDFRSLGHFLEVVFYNCISGVPDPRTPRHVRVVTAFLGGESNITMGTIINLLYNHRQSRALQNSPEAAMDFSPPEIASPRDIMKDRNGGTTNSSTSASVRIGISTAENVYERSMEVERMRSSSSLRVWYICLAQTS